MFAPLGRSPIRPARPYRSATFSGPGGSLRASGRRGERAKAAGETAAELMSAPPVTIGPGAGVADAARLMFEHGSNGCRWSMAAAS
jgi:CBS domain-containing protein